MRWLLTAAVQIGIIVAAMATTVPVNAFAQTAEARVKSTPAAKEISVATPSSVTTASKTNEDPSLQTGTRPKVQVGIERLIEIGIEQRSNELRSELLDERADTINFWLAVVAILFALIGILGIAEFKRLRRNAQNIVDEIKEKRDEVDKIHQDVTAEYADENPTKTKRTIDKALETRQVSLVDKAIARAVSLQREGKREQASEIWRGVAHVTEDQGLAARAWFSVGYLLRDNRPEKAIRAYDNALRLDPSGAGAYTNRGIAKTQLGCYEEAIADFDQAIRLNPKLAEAFFNRGLAKSNLDLKKEAQADLNVALDLARKLGNANLAATAKQALRRLDG